MKLSTQKHIYSVKDDRDRLSEMPDDIIVRILSCMSTIDAVRTVLLRRFGNLWTFIHTINFADFVFPDELCTWGNNKLMQWFCRFIHNVLMLHQNPFIDKFHLSIEFDEAPDDITEWLMFALGKKAKEIRLFDDRYYNFSLSSIFSKLKSQFLVTLDLDYCTFTEEFQVKLESLQKLSLYRVRMTNKSFQSFISGCPSLQELVIVNPVWVTKLSFSAANISKFSLSLTEDCDEYYYGKKSLSLNFPNLKSLYLESQLCKLDIIDISSVSDVYVNYPEVEYPSPHLPPQIKKIFLYSYGKGKSWKSQLRLTELLLKSGKVLDKLVIVPMECRLKEADQLEFVKLVSRFPRASPTARIIFA
ncbi:putative F-box/LRR-repeat protein At5g41630 [Silene latifolia]|uniref:putative F-box/LRR-repeat protein At5g41630 n=1 Tax=Silene latifolia TaxID=37657 RepID=UPI003D781982